MGNCDNKYWRIDHCLDLSLRSSASLIIPSAETRQAIKSFLSVSREKKTGGPKPVYATVLMVKVTKFIGFWYPHPTSFDGSASL